MRTVLLSALLLASQATAARATEDSLRVGRFGSVHLYQQSAKPSRVVLFVSGDGGWNKGVVDMARELAGLDALVAGVDITHYLAQLDASSEKCVYPAADFEALSQAVQKSRAFERYVTPVLVGYSSGATLVYAVIAQAPRTTFRGAISLGFCPDLALTRPLCPGDGLETRPNPHAKGVLLLPAPGLETPWILLQGTIDQVCDPESTVAYAKRVHGAEVVLLPKVGHGYSVPSHWMPQFKAAFERLCARADPSAVGLHLQVPAAGRTPGAGTPATTALENAALPHLPLTEVASAGTESDLLALHLTGDGGYGVTDQGIATMLAQHGTPVVVLNSLHYFWKAHTPDAVAADVELILRHYLTAWNKQRVALIGYSRGADVLPFVIDRLPQDLKQRITFVAFVGLGSSAEFELHVPGWLGGGGKHEPARPVRPELEKLRGMRLLCFYGSEDSDTLCRDLDPSWVQCIAVRSGHRIRGNYGPIADALLQEIARR
jgi:type IV secretory pathway VirJ component